MKTIILLCNEKYLLLAKKPSVQKSIIKAREDLEKGELSHWEWSVGKQENIKVGYRVYIQKTSTYSAAGYFAAGWVTSAQPSQRLNAHSKYANFDDCYLVDRFDGKYLVAILVDSVVDYDSQLKRDNLKQKPEFEGADFHVREGYVFDKNYNAFLDQAWAKHLKSQSEKGISIFTALERKGCEHMQHKDFDAALQTFEGALERAENARNGTWIDSFSKRKQTCLNKIREHRYSDLRAESLRIEAEGYFDPANLEDARKRIIVSIVQRQGQSKFRQRLLTVYGSRCPITGCNTEFALEAAHIIPYQGAETNHPTNGFPLRADVYTLFDLFLISVDPGTYKIVIAPELVETCYQDLAGQALMLPQDEKARPNQDALRMHYTEFSAKARR